jgi:imidazolonepropionase-like amidohydrolase
LGLDDKVGTLTPGKFANLAVIALPEHEPTDPHELVFDSEQSCRMTVFRGQVVRAQQ